MLLVRFLIHFRLRVPNGSQIYGYGLEDLPVIIRFKLESQCRQSTGLWWMCRRTLPYTDTLTPVVVRHSHDGLNYAVKSIIGCQCFQTVDTNRIFDAGDFRIRPLHAYTTWHTVFFIKCYCLTILRNRIFACDAIFSYLRDDICM